ncbi:MAG: hypothetical protein HUJ27_02475 [Rhodobacteraceae bacterium]|nr:hypothetical protein [Paracoccaceae bacterium]
MWAVWWVWMAGAVVLAILEVIAPAYIFLGFAIGAFATGVLLIPGGPMAGWMAGTLSGSILVFAVLSLLGWIALRKILGVREGQVKVWDRDINED